MEKNRNFLLNGICIIQEKTGMLMNQMSWQVKVMNLNEEVSEENPNILKIINSNPWPALVAEAITIARS